MKKKADFIKNNLFNIESVSAIFIIALVGAEILVYFAKGFFLPFYLLTMFVSAIIAFVYPRSGVISIIFLTLIFERFFTLQTIFWGRSEYKLYPIDILFFAVMAGLSFELLSGKIKFIWKRSDTYLLLFFIITVAQFAFSVFVSDGDFDLAFSALKNYLWYALFYVAAVLLFKERSCRQRLFNFSFAGVIGIAGFIIFGIINGNGLWTEYTPLTTSGMRILAFPHAFYLSLTVIGFLSYLLVNKKTAQFNGSFFIGSVWAIGIIGSLMRNIWLGMAGAGLALWIMLPEKERKNMFSYMARFAFVISVVALVVFYVGMLFPKSSAGEYVTDIGSALFNRASSVSLDDASVNWRYEVWRAAVRDFIKNPVTGIGMGKMVAVEIDKYNYRTFIELRDVHNSLLAILFQMGLVSFACLGLFIWEHVREILKIKKRRWSGYALSAQTVFLLIVVNFQPYLETNLLSIFFWITLGLLRTEKDAEKISQTSE